MILGCTRYRPIKVIRSEAQGRFGREERHRERQRKREKVKEDPRFLT